MSNAAARKSLPRRASLYVRLSREAQEENLSRDGMVADCRRTAEEQGYEVVAVHVDDGISGSVRNRPEFLAWLADATEGRADALVAWHVDRMTREGVNVVAAIMDAVEGKDPVTGKKVRPPVRLLDTKGLDSDGDETAFRFQFVIKAEVARAERARMADRTSQAKRRAMEAGRWIGGLPPYGFRVVPNPDGPGVVLDTDPDEAALIKECAARVLAGENLTAVVRFANGPHGHPPRRADRWQRPTLRQVLTGHPVEGKVVRRVNGSRSEVVPVLDERGQPVTIPAILTPDEAAAVRQKLAPKRENKGGRQPSRLLSGIVRCSGCGERLFVARPANRNANYRCVLGKEAGTCKRPVQIDAEGTEAIVTRRFLETYGDQPAMVRRATVTGAAAVEAAETAKSEALKALADSPTATAFAALQAAQEALDEAMALPQETEVRLVPTGRTVREEWEAAELPERRAMLAQNVAALVIGPGEPGWGSRRGTDERRVSLVWNAPFPTQHAAPEDLPLRAVVVDAPEVEWDDAFEGDVDLIV